VPLHLRIVTIEKVVVDEPVDLLSVTTSEGATGILSGHIPLLAVIEPGLLRYKTKSREFRMVSSSGSVEVKDNRATVLVSEAVPVESIDLAKAEAERNRLLGDIKGGQLTAIELSEAREQLATVAAKLRARK
jgi:F-type H+-transporting ATPase subunit epsilon